MVVRFPGGPDRDGGRTASRPGRALVQRQLGWLLANVDVLVALVLAVFAGIYDLLGDPPPSLVDNATVITLALLAFVLLRDRRREAETTEAVHALADRIDRENPVRVVVGPEIGRALSEARFDTDQWLFKGATATFVRAVTLPDLLARALYDRRELRVRLEILDPADVAACTCYVNTYRSGASTGGAELGWTVRDTQIELLATILSMCWYRQRHGQVLRMEIGLAPVATVFRYELSSRYCILTVRGPRFPATVIHRSDPYYDLWAFELLTSFRQARRLAVESVAETVPLSPRPTLDEARTLFAELDVDLALTDPELETVIEKALRQQDPYRQA